jgi:hypothetical protein
MTTISGLNAAGRAVEDWIITLWLEQKSSGHARLIKTAFKTSIPINTIDTLKPNTCVAVRSAIIFDIECDNSQ